MGYKITVNDEEVWESDGDALLVDRVSVSNARGEITSIGSPALDDTLVIRVNVRNAPSDSGTYLDIMEADKAQERRDMVEGSSADAVAEGRKIMADEEKAAQEEASQAAQESADETTVETEESPELGPPAPVPDMEF